VSQIISIHSFRGGTGKSNLTANLATCIALRGSRVGIVDTDIQSPGIHVLFELDSDKMPRALNDYLWGKCAIEEAAYEVTPPPVAEAGGHLWLIPSSIKTGEITRVLREGYDVGLLNDGFHELIQKLALDYLFIDTHPGLNEETLLCVAISDALIIILRPDRQDLQGTAVTVDVARKLGVPQMQLVVNKVPASLDTPMLRLQVETAFHAPVIGILPETEEMLELGSNGVFCLHYPDHPLTRQFVGLVASLLGET
jgi:MinD-like ATPase involved in chromosome partitioning or flagellar assembly